MTQVNLNSKVAPDTSRFKYIKIFDYLMIAVAISLGIGAFLTSDDLKTVLTFLGIFPAFYLAARAAYDISASRSDSSVRRKTSQLWISLIINVCGVFANAIIVIVRLFHVDLIF